MEYGFSNAKHSDSMYGFSRKEPQRFYLKQGQTKEIIFVDDVPAVFTEHKVWLNGKYQHFTCLKDQCPLCNIGLRAEKVFSLTAIDTTPWTDRSGDIHRESLVLFVGKMNVAQILKKEKERQGKLKDLKFSVSRDNQIYAPIVGNSFTLINDSPQLGESYSPFNYQDILKEKSVNELLSVADTIISKDGRRNER